jgi:pimeloyl-ACP methyl ester carboxylesterase
MFRKVILTAALAFALLPLGAYAQTPRIVTETLMIPARDPGITLHVRNKHLDGLSQFAADRIVLFVHGATYPSETGFDIPLGGVSWMDYVAARGFDVYVVDVRGYGRSTRPPAMGQPAPENPPFARTPDAVNDVGAAVDFILARRGVTKINLVGWSWGTAIMAGYTAKNNEKVNRLALYATLWTLKSAGPISGAGAYRSVQKDPARQRGIRGIPPDRVQEISPDAWFDQWWAANLATDPDGARQTPPVVRAPNGVIDDIAKYWAQGKPTWDPAEIRVPVLMVIAEWDQDTPLYMSYEVFPQLKNAPLKRLVVLGEGTHAIALEKNRGVLFQQVQTFLEEAQPR